MTERDTLIAYLRMKVEQADWHGVSDAANDLRVLEASMVGFPEDRGQSQHDQPSDGVDQQRP